MHKNRDKIKDVLEKLYEKYNHHNFIKPDPLQFVYNYTEQADMEIAGFLASALAYGRVQQIEKSLTELFKLMGKSPAGFIKKFDKNKRAKLEKFKHRFTTGNDLANLFELLKVVLTRFSGLEEFFLMGYKKGEKNIARALSQFCDSLLAMHSLRHDEPPGQGLKYLLVSPANGSACKRLNLFLRWMVRDDDVDTGLWNSVDKARLIVPVDVHINRLCQILGFHDRKTVSMRTAMEITQGFAEINPCDPVEYDFALSRIGIIENCDGHLHKDCRLCELFRFCCDK